MPNASYNINTDGSMAAASVQEVEDTYYQSILEQLFSYEDYLKFIDMYIKLQQTEQEEVKAEQEKEEDKQNDSYHAYQGLRYTPVVMNLLGQ